mgnify:CR=1 FL=1
MVFQRVRSFYHFKIQPQRAKLLPFQPLQEPTTFTGIVTFFSNFRSRALRAPHPSEGSGDRSGSFSIAVAAQASGGPQLHTTFLTEDMFAAAAMRALATDLMAMEVTVYTELINVCSELFIIVRPSHRCDLTAGSGDPRFLCG